MNALMAFQIRINGMKPVWASPGIHAVNQRYEVRMDFTGACTLQNRTYFD